MRSGQAFQKKPPQAERLPNMRELAQLPKRALSLLGLRGENSIPGDMGDLNSLIRRIVYDDPSRNFCFTVSYDTPTEIRNLDSFIWGVIDYLTAAVFNHFGFIIIRAYS
jgi:hypothetical protein